MSRLAADATYWLKRIGRPGVAGIALAVFAGMFTLSAIVPASENLRQLRQEAGSAREQLRKMARLGVDGGEGQAQRLAAFQRFFPELASAPDWLDKIYGAAARQSLVLEQADYKLLRSKEARLAAYQINLPVRGSYLQIRNFIVEVLNEVPAAALEDVSFQRQAVGSATVEGRVRLTLYLRQP